MSAKESEKSSRVMERAGKPYYEYRDSAMSSVAPFRPEWIMELCYVKTMIQKIHCTMNNGHFMHSLRILLRSEFLLYR